MANRFENQWVPHDTILGPRYRDTAVNGKKSSKITQTTVYKEQHVAVLSLQGESGHESWYTKA